MPTNFKMMMEFDLVDTSVRKKQGNVGVTRALYEYTKLGYTVLVPISDSDKYDMVVDTGTELLRVQVKTSRCKVKDYRGYNRTGFSINLSTKGGNTKVNTIRNRQDGDYDLLFVLLETGACFSIPSKELGTKGSSINLDSSKCQFQEYKL